MMRRVVLERFSVSFRCLALVSSVDERVTNAEPTLRKNYVDVLENLAVALCYQFGNSWSRGFSL